MRPNIGPVQDLTSEEVEQVMLKMKMGNAAGPCGVPIEWTRGYFG